MHSDQVGIESFVLHANHSLPKLRNSKQVGGERGPLDRRTGPSQGKLPSCMSYFRTFASYGRLHLWFASTVLHYLTSLTGPPALGRFTRVDWDSGRWGGDERESGRSRPRSGGPPKLVGDFDAGEEFEPPKKRPTPALRYCSKENICNYLVHCLLQTMRIPFWLYVILTTIQQQIEEENHCLKSC